MRTHLTLRIYPIVKLTGKLDQRNGLFLLRNGSYATLKIDKIFSTKISKPYFPNLDKFFIRKGIFELFDAEKALGGI